MPRRTDPRVHRTAYRAQYHTVQWSTASGVVCHSVVGQNWFQWADLARKYRRGVLPRAVARRACRPAGENACVASDDQDKSANTATDQLYPAPAAVTRRAATAEESRRASHQWWDVAADAYQREHGTFLGDRQFVWGPEGLDEADARLLGDVAGSTVLEIGCGAGQCGRWLVTQGARVVGLELSGRQLNHSRRLDRRTGVALDVVQADATRLPFADASFDLVCSSYGALPFLADAPAVLRGIQRVLRPGGRFVFSVSHPMRWSFLDDPGEGGLVAVHSYFDRRAYVEEDDRGVATYVEHHRTVGDWVRAITAADLRLTDLVEPEWPAGHERTWGGWSPLRGRIIPGTAIFVCVKAP